MLSNSQLSKKHCASRGTRILCKDGKQYIMLDFNKEHKWAVCGVHKFDRGFIKKGKFKYWFTKDMIDRVIEV